MVVLKTEGEIDAMRHAGYLAADVLDMIASHVRPGVSTLELNDRCHSYILEHGAIPAPLNYRGFPKSICTSINEVVCHGIPSPKVRLRAGDIINIDITTILDGFHGDTSRMFLVGDVSDEARQLVEVTEQCLRAGIGAVAPGARLGDIGHAIQTLAERHGYSVVRDFVGHGIGRQFHEDPQVPHYGEAGRGPRIQAGMVFTIEPMINAGRWQTRVLGDQWTAVTIDGKLSAQFEHTLAVHADGRVEILTLPARERGLGTAPGLS